jgi:hypothetical protein
MTAPTASLAPALFYRDPWAAIGSEKATGLKIALFD